MNDNWEDKFAAYDIGLPKSNGTSSNDATDIVSEVAPPIFLQDEQVVSSIKPETVKADKSVQRIQTKRYMDFPETGNMDLTAADLQQMSIHQENYKRVIGEMYNQALKMSAPDTSLRLPKGLRTIVQHLGDIVHVITATKVGAPMESACSEIRTQPLLISLVAPSFSRVGSYQELVKVTSIVAEGQT